MCAVINKANILTMGGWVLAPQHAIDLVERWLSAGFTEGFPPDRQQFLCNAFEQVCKIEQENSGKWNRRTPPYTARLHPRDRKAP